MNMSAMSMARNFYTSFAVSQKANLLGGLPSSDFSSLTGVRPQSTENLQALAKKFESFEANKAKIRDQYKELVKSTDFDIKDFFSHNANVTATGNTKASDKVNPKQDPALQAVTKSAKDLKNAADAILKTGEASILKLDKSGKLNAEAIKSAVSNFISAYNGTVDTVSKSGNSNVMSKGVSMMNLSAVNKDLLSKIGITSDKSGKLKLDEATLAKADEKALKQIFDGKYSYMSRMKRAADNITNVVQGAKQKTYSNVSNTSFSMANTLGLGNFLNFTA